MKTIIIALSAAALFLAACGSPTPATVPATQPPVAAAPAALPVAAAPSPTQAPSPVPTVVPTVIPTAVPPAAAPSVTATKPAATTAVGAPTTAAAQAAPGTASAGAPPAGTGQSAAGRPAAPVGTPTPRPTPLAKMPAGVPAAQALMWTNWALGPHANTYGLEKGPNTYCARCHSPANWVSTAKVDDQPNCVSCKFPTDPQVRQAKDNLLVSAQDWKSIGCEVCHQVDAGGAVAKGIAWRDPVTGQYMPVKTSTDLCEKCHADTDTLRHHRDLGTAAHKGFTCTTCHDAHSGQASCTAANCHAAIKTAANPPAGHDAAHAQVDCVACHDAGGLQVGRVKETGIWTTWRTTELLGRKTNAAYQSHNLQKTVDCSRCHFPGNGFGLPENVKAKP